MKRAFAYFVAACAAVALGAPPLPVAAQSAPPATLDLNGASLSFDAVAQTVEPSSLVGAPMTAGQSLVYRNVVTVGGYVVDALITLVSVDNLVNGQVDYTDQSNTSPYLDGVINSTNTAGPTATGNARYRMAFYHGGTYTTPGTGTPVALLGLDVSAYDVDNQQFVEFGGFTSYQLATNTLLTVSSQPGGRTRFAESTNTSTSNGSGTARTRGRVTVTYDSVQSLEYVYGVVQPDDGAVYSIDLAADGQAWTDNVGGGAAAVTPNPTLSLSSVGPTTGPALGGVTVTLRGSGFVSGTTARIGTATCTNVVIVSASELTCTVPAGSGVVDVSVTNPDSSTASLTSAFTYQAPIPTTTTTTTTTTVATTTAPPTTAAPAQPTTPSPAMSLALSLAPDATLTSRQFTLSGNGLRPGSTVTIRIQPGTAVLGTATVRGDGTFAVDLTVPAGLAAGRYEVLADGIAADGSPTSTRSSFVIDDLAELASTGRRSAELGLLGVIGIVSGFLLVRLQARRRINA